MSRASQLTPSILQQVFESGDSCTGVAYEGTAAVLRESDAFPARDGRVYRNEKVLADGAIDGGLFPVGALRDRAYNTVQAVWAKLPGCTAVAAYALDEDGNAYLFASSATDTLIVSSPNTYDLMPGWSLQIVGTGALTGDGAITAMFTDWGHPVPFPLQ